MITSQCAWLVLGIIIQALIIFFLIQDSALSHPILLSKRLLSFSEKKCENGKVFIYDLPPTFNKQLLENCHDLDPWKSLCPAVSNGGFGPKAASYLTGVVPGNIAPAWYWTDMYAAEVIYHLRMMNYECRTLKPLEATAFYVPFYPGLAIGKYLFSNYTAKDRDRHGEMLLDWIKEQSSWKKRNGSDHFLVFGRLTWDFRRLTNQDSDWGSRFMYMPEMQNVLKISAERNTWDELEFSVPYPTAFHPRSKSDLAEWQGYIRARTRKCLFSFVGATRKKIRNDFRGLLMEFCKSESSCRVVDCSATRCSEGEPAILETFLDSDFCLQPKGDGYTRRSFFDCLMAGSIPVFFWVKSFKGQYEWHLPSKPESYSVFIDHRDVRLNGTVNIRNKLEGFSQIQIRKMRETVIDLLPRILYAESSKNGSGDFKDAFDVTIESVLKKLELDSKKNQSIG
ncbi:OLC1v1024591C1 [Oldenlandia corymbosa var. corymbosa]|uniref:OLC1v1024591C1 n=1 Tax=Oldenlandia corymbosa var. corymbosa TaxID=529605 RepID=A0AAV1C5S4_OLDCO|nr:OLC1v1024591C1 [Oldenlandia corymbosa var. corymbosa]